MNSPRLALVTGASRGLGRAIALRLAAGGDRVLIGYRQRSEEAERTRAAIAEAGGESELLGFDVRDAQSCERAFASARDRHGPISVLVNNAAIPDEGWFAMSSDQRFEDVFGVAVDGTIRCSRLAVRDMLANPGGSIVNVSSVVARRGQPGQTAYATSKGAIEAFTRAVAIELAPKAIRVNAVVAGAFDAGMTRMVDAATRDRWKSYVPLGRLGMASELAEAVHWLCSDAASYVTGHCLVVDGGLSL